jgi:hypothetical protein
MHRQIQWFTIFVMTSFLPVICEAQQPFVHGSDVVFAIRADQKKYVIGDPIIIRYTVKNVSNGSLFVPRSQWDIRCGDPPHLWARLEDQSGKHYEPGFGGSCLGPSLEDGMSISERMQKDAVLVKPGQVVHGSFAFQPKVFSDLKAGYYRLEAVLYGWNLSFNTSELSELHKMGAPFLIGETQATTRIELQLPPKN